LRRRAFPLTLQAGLPLDDWRHRTMKIPSAIFSLLIAASVPLAASAAVALPSSASSSLRAAGAAPIQIVRHRPRAPQHHRVAPTDHNDYYGSYNRSGGEGVDDWSHWSPSHHPGWPCIGNGSDASETSAYPAWEMKPQCQ
jgi:hypothetical protein